MHDERVQLAQCGAATARDRPQRRPRVVAELARLGLHHHRGDVVADHVMQLAGQVGALFQPGGLAAQVVCLPGQGVAAGPRSQQDRQEVAGRHEEERLLVQPSFVEPARW